MTMGMGTLDARHECGWGRARATGAHWGTIRDVYSWQALSPGGPRRYRHARLCEHCEQLMHLDIDSVWHGRATREEYEAGPKRWPEGLR